MKRSWYQSNYETDKSHEDYYRQLADAARRAVPDRDAWQPDPMRQPDPADIADNWSDQ